MSRRTRMSTHRISRSSAPQPQSRSSEAVRRLGGDSTAAPAVAPQNVVEPAVSGTTRVGQVLRTTRGTWTGTGPIDYAFRWFRCDGPGAPDASDCRRISNASDNTYVLREG